MSRQTHENVLISAMINMADAGLARTYGVLPEHFVGHQDEYRWVLNYSATYSKCPVLSELLAAFPDFYYSEDATEARWPADGVKRAFANRELLRKMANATVLIQSGKVEEAYAEFDDMILETASEPPQNVLVDHSYLDDYLTVTDDRIRVPWGTLQGLTQGIGPGELWYLAARQGQGKSSLLTYLAAEAVRNGHTVLMYSLEMTRRQIQSRMHAALGSALGHRVSNRDMMHKKFGHSEYKLIIQDIEDKIPGQMFVHDSAMGRVTPATIAARAGDYDLILVDYVGLMYTDEGTPAIKDYRAMAEISNNLSEIVQSKSARIIGVSQINREGDSSSVRPPALKTLAQSDHLGNDASVVLTMKRYGTAASMISIEKNRFGPSRNLFFTNYDADRGDFREITAEKAQDLKDASDDEQVPTELHTINIHPQLWTDLNDCAQERGINPYDLVINAIVEDLHR